MIRRRIYEKLPDPQEMNIMDGTGRKIATIYGDNDNELYSRFRLFAASPDLLHALKMIHKVVHEHYCGIMGTDYHSSLCRIATEAIQKAEHGE